LAFDLQRERPEADTADQRMGAAENWIPHVRGKRAMHELARATFAALEEAELQEALDAMRERVLGRGPDIVEITDEGGICQWRFKPMVELLLRHALEAAGRDDVPAGERQREIATALHLAGF
jgi:hypothetical protein